MANTPVYRVSVVSRSTQAVNYRNRKGSTKIDFEGTELLPEAKGEARIDSKPNGLNIAAGFEHMPSARTFGPAYLTYVLWAITPEGRAQNLGELLLEDGKGTVHVTTDLQAFGLIVTAEPYFAVTRPSNLVVVENRIRANTKGWEQPINAKFDALQKGEYTADLTAADLPGSRGDKNIPLDLLEAENAVAIAKATGAEKYAPDSLHRAQDFLNRGEDYYQRHQSKQAIGTVTRGAAQAAEDARLLTIRRKQDEQAAQQRAEQQRKVDEARLQAEQDQQRRAEAEHQRELAEQQRRLAEQAQQQAMLQQQQAAADAERARAAAQQAEQARLQAQQQTEQMRQRLLEQLNSVLQTRETARGLVANMPDVLFDTGKSTLKPTARERLAKIAGIVLAYPDLKLQIEGYTDGTGSEEFNQQLSEKRAAAVRDYLVTQGVSLNNVTAQGYGMNNPVASNSTADGRRQNRRVDLVVSGTAIGRQSGQPTSGNASADSASYDSGARSVTSNPQTDTTNPNITPSTPSTPAAAPTTCVSNPPPQQ